MRASSIQYCFHYLRRAGASVGAHTHNGCELVYYSSGSGTVRYGGEEMPFAQGMISLTHPGTPHGESWDKDTDVWCVIFDGVEDALLPEGVYTDNNGKIFSLLQALFREQQDNLYGRDEISLSYLEIVLQLMARSNCAILRSRAVFADRLDSAFNYIRDYFNTDISFEELALSIGYSYDRFRHLFKARYNITPKKLVLTRRIEMAGQLLRETDEKIENIARSCGFGSVPQFNVIFKQHRGMTPKEYRTARRTKKEQV